MIDFIDGQGGNRTPDTRIFSPLLYQLSYLADCHWSVRPKTKAYGNDRGVICQPTVVKVTVTKIEVVSLRWLVLYSRPLRDRPSRISGPLILNPQTTLPDDS